MEKLAWNCFKWGWEVCFPTNTDLADILGDTDFDFENSFFGKKCWGPIFKFPQQNWVLKMPTPWAWLGPNLGQLGPRVGPPTWAPRGPTHLGPAWAHPLGPHVGPPTLGPTWAHPHGPHAGHPLGPTWAHPRGPTHLGPTWAHPRGPRGGPPTVYGSQGVRAEHMTPNRINSTLLDHQGK